MGIAYATSFRGAAEMNHCLFQYDEFAPGMGYPSMKDSFCRNPYPGQSRIVDYLRKGRKTFTACSKARDVFTGELIPDERCGMTDEEYSWMGPLAYYVEKYNLRLDPEFESKVLNLP